MEWGADLIGIALLVIGAILGFQRRRRKFDRTNEFGVEQFQSYGGKLGARFKDGLLGLASIFLVSSGILILAFQYQDSWGWIVLLPACAIMLFALLGA